MAANAFLSLVRYIRAIPKSDIEEVRQAAQRQVDYADELRKVYEAEQQALGRFNLEVARRVEELREFMIKGPDRVLGSKILPPNPVANGLGEGERLQ